VKIFEKREKVHSHQRHQLLITASDMVHMDGPL